MVIVNTLVLAISSPPNGYAERLYALEFNPARWTCPSGAWVTSYRPTQRVELSVFPLKIPGKGPASHVCYGQEGEYDPRGDSVHEGNGHKAYYQSARHLRAPLKRPP